MGARLGWPELIACLLVAAAATPASAWQSTAAYRPSAASSSSAAPAAGTREGAAACTPAAIRWRWTEKQTPALTGCRYDDVSGPLMSFHFMPLPTKVFNAAEAGVVVSQTPAANAPGKPSLILLQISKGPKPQVETPPAASSSVSEASSALAPASQSSASQSSSSQSSASQSPASPAPSSASASSTSTSTVSPPAAEGGPEPGEIAGLLWGAIQAYPLPAIIAALAAILLAALGLRGGKPRGRGGAAPRVRCDLEPGASRLILSGPLVLGRKGDA